MMNGNENVPIKYALACYSFRPFFDIFVAKAHASFGWLDKI